MFNYNSKIYIAIAVILLAVILFLIGLANFLKNNNTPSVNENIITPEVNRHPLSGLALSEDCQEFFPVAIMIDNAYDIRPQDGLSQADIIYEAYAEANITRLMAIFDSNITTSKVGPVRSARSYFMDWAEEYGGVYLHVGGSPEALAKIGQYNFTNIDQIGAGEIYFWRDNNLNMPHNVFSSSANWLRAGELKEVASCNRDIAWNFVTPSSTTDVIQDIKIDFSDYYLVDWQYNDGLAAYQRWQSGDKFIYNTGEQAIANNIIVQVVESKIVDSLARRTMNTQIGGQVFIFNSLGRQEGEWRVVDNRTRFYDINNQELKLVPGKTWVEIIPSEEMLVIN